MLRRFDCRNCGTVYAAVDPPAACDDCGSHRIAELDDDDGAAQFFAGVLR